MNIDAALGTVEAIASGTVKIAWGDGSQIDEKYYRTLASYTPAVGDRVLAIRLSGTYLVIGKIAYK